MQVRIELLEDAFWGSGESIPGAEDSSILMDEHGFPYLRRRNGELFCMDGSGKRGF